MGLQPQYDLHYAGVYPSASGSGPTQNSKKLPKSLFGETRNNIIRTHLYAHPQHMRAGFHLLQV